MNTPNRDPDLARPAPRAYGRANPVGPVFMRLAPLFLITIAACTEFPALDGTIPPRDANAPFPALVPLAPLVAQANAADRGAADVETALTPRLAALRARAARLRGPVIPPAVRARMVRGVR